MKIYLVGGAVRDQLLGFPIKERDWVVVGATVADMLKQGYRQVGKEFPVFLHPETGEEYALARLERKVASGYKGFTFDTSPDVSLKDDLLRRDLTINAIAETESGELIDPYHGKQDLEQRILRHVSPAFSEDPVRILRIGRLLARYAHLGFKIAPETMELMRKMVNAGEVNALVAERVWKEVERTLQEPAPHKFFEVLAQCHALAILFPPLLPDNHGIAALKASANNQKLAPYALAIARFAALFHAVPEEKSDKSEARHLINEISRRYRVPNAFKELAQLVAHHYHDALKVKKLSAAKLLQLFYTLDIFRREVRFQHFLDACQLIADAHQKEFAYAFFLKSAQAVKAYPVKILLDEGFNGNQLASELKKRRLVILETFLAENSQ